MDRNTQSNHNTHNQNTYSQNTQFGSNQFANAQYGNAQNGSAQYGGNQYGSSQYGSNQYGMNGQGRYAWQAHPGSYQMPQEVVRVEPKGASVWTIILGALGILLGVVALLVSLEPTFAMWVVSSNHMQWVIGTGLGVLGIVFIIAGAAVMLQSRHKNTVQEFVQSESDTAQMSQANQTVSPQSAQSAQTTQPVQSAQTVQPMQQPESPAQTVGTVPVATAPVTTESVETAAAPATEPATVAAPEVSESSELPEQPKSSDQPKSEVTMEPTTHVERPVQLEDSQETQELATSIADEDADATQEMVAATRVMPTAPTGDEPTEVFESSDKTQEMPKSTQSTASSQS